MGYVSCKNGPNYHSARGAEKINQAKNSMATVNLNKYLIWSDEATIIGSPEQVTGGEVWCLQSTSVAVEDNELGLDGGEAVVHKTRWVIILWTVDMGRTSVRPTLCMDWIQRRPYSYGKVK